MRNDEIVVSITDSGIAIKPEDQPGAGAGLSVTRPFDTVDLLARALTALPVLRL